MGLKLTVDTLDEIDEPLRPLYEEKNGKFTLKVDDLSEFEKQTAIAASKKANQEAKQWREKAKAWEGFQKTPEELTEMLSKYDALLELEEKNQITEAEKKGQWEELKKQMNDKHAAELRKKDSIVEEKDKEISALRDKVQQHLINSAALSAIAQNKGYKELLLPFVKNHLRVGEDFDITVVDDKGELVVDGKGDPMSPEVFVNEMRTNEVFSRAFEGTGATGTGARPGGTSAPRHGITKKSDFKSEAERAKFIDEVGLDAYQKLPMQ